MAAQITIRKARLDELDALTELCMRSKQSNGYDDGFMAACREELTVRECWVHETDLWVAEAGDDKPLGCIQLELSEDRTEGELATCFIDPDQQGRGVGRLLFDELMAKARDLDLKRIYLDADPSAEAFYERLGFTVIGRVPSGSIAGRTLPHMELVLGAK
ncbi:MAG: GNAT family N-acetyltransferase [Roseibium sp.]